jgi:hypothetical protein
VAIEIELSGCARADAIRHQQALRHSGRGEAAIRNLPLRHAEQIQGSALRAATE